MEPGAELTADSHFSHFGWLAGNKAWVPVHLCSTKPQLRGTTHVHKKMRNMEHHRREGTNDNCESAKRDATDVALDDNSATMLCQVPEWCKQQQLQAVESTADTSWRRWKKQSSNTYV